MGAVEAELTSACLEQFSNISGKSKIETYLIQFVFMYIRRLFRQKSSKAKVVSQLEKTKIEVTQFRKHKEEFYSAAMGAGILLLLEVLLSQTFLRKIP